jgi:hypothetical protein
LLGHETAVRARTLECLPDPVLVAVGHQKVAADHGIEAVPRPLIACGLLRRRDLDVVGLEAPVEAENLVRTVENSGDPPSTKKSP